MKESTKLLTVYIFIGILCVLSIWFILMFGMERQTNQCLDYANFVDSIHVHDHPDCQQHEHDSDEL